MSAARTRKALHRTMLTLVALCVLAATACEPTGEERGSPGDGQGAATSPRSANSSAGPSGGAAPEDTVEGTNGATDGRGRGPRARDREALRADLVLEGGTVVDGTGGPPLADAAVAVRDGRILGVGKADELAVEEGARVIDVSGKTVLPGFVNAHAHGRYVGLRETRAWTREGVTTVRDLGGFPEDSVARKRASEGDPRLPRLVVAGPMISVPGGHPFPIYGEGHPALAVTGPEDARAQVNGLLDVGVDHIKIAVSGRTDTGWPELSDAEIRAITDAVHARGARVSVHVDAAAGLRRAVENGVDDAAHSPRDAIPQDLIEQMVRRDVALVPTIDVYQNIAEEGGTAAEWNAATLPVMQDNVRRFAAAGGTLALGDDFGNPGVELGMPMDEIRQWTAAGLEPMRIIVAATRNGARVSGLGEDLGTLEEGKIADVLVVDGDPLADLAALERVDLVLRDGQVAFERQER